MGLNVNQQHIHASVTHDQNGPTVPRAVREGGAKPGGVTFIHADGGERYYSFAEFAAEVDRRALQLRDCGLSKGDRVGLILTENHEFVFSFLGAMAVGVVPVPMYPPLSLGRLDGYINTATRILTAARAKVLLTDRRVQGVLWSLLGRVSGLDSILCAQEVGARPVSGQPDLSAIDLDDTAFIQFTSGSTSTPKGVVVTHRSLLANLHAIMKYGLEISPKDVAVTWLPLYHDMGLIGFVLAPMWYSLPTVYLPTTTFVRHPNLWMDTIHKYRGSLSFAPNFAYALATRRTSPAKLATLDLSCVKVLGCGAEPNHPGTLRAFVEHFAPAGLRPEALLPCYGMAEATLAMTFSRLLGGMHSERIDAEMYHAQGRAVPHQGSDDRATMEFVSCGRPFPGHEVSVVDEQGAKLNEREVGEIIFSGASVSAGYFGQREASAEVFTPAGLKTGDLGYLANGELFVTGRKKDLIILNGRNYDPQSIEWEVAEVAGVRRGNVVAFSRPTAASEELVVVAESKPEVPAEAVKEGIKRRVAEALSLNVADVVILGHGELPKTSSGKLQRRLTREMYLAGTLGTHGVRTLGGRAQMLTLAKHLSLSFMVRVGHGMKKRAELLFAPRWQARRRDDRRQVAND
jgi:fatty-acyl-CoA synthase